MKVSILSENTGKTDEFLWEHGLSILIETNGTKLLFDFGRSEKFIRNAEKLGEDLRQVDYAILSHGHYDHGDGLPAFLDLNEKASVYLEAKAFFPYFSGKSQNMDMKSLNFADLTYIGLNLELKKPPYVQRLYFVDGEKELTDKIHIYGGVHPEKLVSTINHSLYILDEEGIHLDEFQHELNLLIEENGKYYLFAGCAHNGIVNIVEYVQKQAGVQIDVVFGGFHLHTPKKGNQVSETLVVELAQYLKGMSATFYTGHCTGIEEYEQMKQILGEQLHYMSTGSVFQF